MIGTCRVAVGVDGMVDWESPAGLIDDEAAGRTCPNLSSPGRATCTGSANAVTCSASFQVTPALGWCG